MVDFAKSRLVVSYTISTVKRAIAIFIEVFIVIATSVADFNLKSMNCNSRVEATCPSCSDLE